MIEPIQSLSGRALLVHALHAYGLSILREDSNSIFTDFDYCIEIEGPHLFKLSQDGYIVAPYDDVDELCQMIKRG